MHEKQDIQTERYFIPGDAGAVMGDSGDFCWPRSGNCGDIIRAQHVGWSSFEGSQKETTHYHYSICRHQVDQDHLPVLERP